MIFNRLLCKAILYCIFDCTLPICNQQKNLVKPRAFVLLIYYVFVHQDTKRRKMKGHEKRQDSRRQRLVSFLSYIIRALRVQNKKLFVHEYSKKYEGSIQ